jgi:hypothetical protein
MLSHRAQRHSRHQLFPVKLCLKPPRLCDSNPVLGGLRRSFTGIPGAVTLGRGRAHWRHSFPAGDFAPPGPPTRSLVGPLQPRSALVAHSLRSFARRASSGRLSMSITAEDDQDITPRGRCGTM